MNVNHQFKKALHPIPSLFGATEHENGLSQAVAKARLKAEGANELPATDGRNLLNIALEVVREPMFLLLVAAGTIYFALGDVSDALMLLGFVCIVMAITIYQENKTERVLETLRDLTSPRALVIRDGIEQRIAGREVVRGDVLVLSEGDRIAADAVLIACNYFSADESLLTGESVAVHKTAQVDDNVTDSAVAEDASLGGEGSPFIYAGSLVVQGHGLARVLATGLYSEIGKIGKALQGVDNEVTPLQLEIRRLVRYLAIIGAFLCVLLLVIYGLTRGDWLHGLLSGITLAMTILPEEYPVVLAVFMAMGAWRISKHNVLTRRMPTVEALGSATVLCVDKTGTLTFNRMAVQQLLVNGALFEADQMPEVLPEDFHELTEFSILASQIAPFDPMEKAIHSFGQHYLADTEHLHGDWQLAYEYALSPEMLALSQVWKAVERDDYVVAAKGAPEAIADLCHLNPQQLAILSEQVNTLAAKGLRILGVAKATYSGSGWPDIQHDFDFEFLGLIGLADPVRPTVAPAIKQCHAAGIRVVMITGDYPATAASIAAQIGLDIGTNGIITGAELSQMDEAALSTHIQHSNVFARMVPEQKLRLVNALKANGEVVAMTGDGVNDAPALKAAHIGIAMGGRGTDVAREAAALVLLNDDFASIVHAVRLGRGIFDNLRKGMAYIFAVHIPIVGLSFIPLLLGWPAVFAPVHIVFLEMIINPACSIAFEAEPAEANVMHRPPRPPKEPLFGRRILLISLFQGFVVLLVALLVLAYALFNGQSDESVRTLTFSVLVVGNLGLILVNRSWRRTILQTLNNRNPALWWVVGGALTFLILAMTVPFLRGVFHFSAITVPQFALCTLAGLVSVLWFEVYKMVKR
ncbi:calcium-transporting ATPase 1 [mine drainage metagenome]|uniref:P-type Cu(+) transporter n=1 Tax=mine drainage metagenome TaxID=410659 RepID=A0A1J5R5P9_9ZZZZ